jgi:hypothetical protein
MTAKIVDQQTRQPNGRELWSETPVGAHQLGRTYRIDGQLWQRLSELASTTTINTVDRWHSSLTDPQLRSGHIDAGRHRELWA